MAQRYGKRIQPERNAKGSFGTGRIHIVNPLEWGTSAGTDYWANFSSLSLVPAGGQALEDNGWVESGTFVTVAGTGADLLSSATKGTSGGANIDTAADGLTSPYIFGDFAHLKMVEALLGYTPVSLHYECYARFAANNDEESSGFGFSEAGAAEPAVKAGHMAFITSDGTNFTLESGAAVAVSDDLDNTAAHLWRVNLFSNGDAITWAIDGVTQASTLALQAALFPVAWGAAAQTANDPVINWVHIWYE